MRPLKADHALIRHLAEVKKLYFILDYDGTLAPLRRLPSLAKLKSEIRCLLKELSAMAGCKVAIVSGRSLASLERFVRLEEVSYAGNHGLERKINGRRTVDSAASKLRPAIAQLARNLKKALRQVPGGMVEDKTYGVCVHYRNASPGNFFKIRSLFKKTWIQFPLKRLFKVSSGKKIWEIRPRGGCSDKGKAVFALLRTLPRSWKRAKVVCAGDDRTDEDAFKVLRNSDVSIRIGDASQTHARYRLKSPAELAQFLKSFIGIRQKKVSK